MKTSAILFLFLTLNTLISCSSSSSSSSSSSNQEEAYVNPHVAAHEKAHGEFMIEEAQKEINTNYLDEISGNYMGKIPCADCEGIIYRLQLNDDKTYQSTITYKGKSVKPILKTGTYTINNRLIIQLDDQSGMSFFKKQSEGLLMLDKNGNEITGDLADKYILNPVNNNDVEKINQQYMQKKWKEGIDFYANGNEPFWSLDMDFEKGYRFKNLDGLEFKTPPVEPVKAMDADVTRYRAVTESGEIIIQLNHTECIDNMSGEKFDYSVTIDIKTGKETEYKTYKGCGNYVPDYRLHNIWAIIEVDSIKIDSANFKKNAPRIEINLTNENVYGADGCNTFRGSVKVERNMIYFGNLASTMMACLDNNEISAKIGNILSGNQLTFKFENNLVLYDNDKKVMVLKNID